MADPRLREIFWFLVVGGASALLYLALNVSFTKAGMRPSVSILCTLAILMPPTYWLQRRLTFRSDRGHMSAFPRYVGTQLLGNAFALVLAELFANTIRAHPTIAFFLMALVVAAVNYGVLKFWAFRQPPVAAA